MIDVIYWLFVVANIILFFGTCLLIRGVIKNRNSLKDFDPLGSILTFIPCSMFAVVYVIMNNWVSLCFCLVTVIFWLMASIFSIRIR